MNERREIVNTPINKTNGEPTVDPLEKGHIFLYQLFPTSKNDTIAPTNPEQEKEIENNLQRIDQDPLSSE